MMSLIPPSLLAQLPPIVTALLVLFAGIAYLLREWRKGLAQRADEAETKLKETRQEADSKIGDLQKTIDEMKVDFDLQLSEIKAKLNEQIERLEKDNVTQRTVIYRLRTRMAENGLEHADIT